MVERILETHSSQRAFREQLDEDLDASGGMPETYASPALLGRKRKVSKAIEDVLDQALGK